MQTKVKSHSRSTKGKKNSKVKSHARKTKIGKVMHEWKQGSLHSGSKHGKIVSNKKQAIAIAISEAKHPYKK